LYHLFHASLVDVLVNASPSWCACLAHEVDRSQVSQPGLHLCIGSPAAVFAEIAEAEFIYPYLC